MIKVTKSLDFLTMLYESKIILFRFIFLVITSYSQDLMIIEEPWGVGINFYSVHLLFLAMRYQFHDN
jgi:hypothetical protein